MRKSLTFVASAALFLGMSLSVMAEDAPSASTVVTTVNGTDITIGHMIIARASLPEQFTSMPDDVLWNGILDQLIQQVLLADAHNGDVPANVTLSLENQERAMIAGLVVRGYLEDAVTEEAIQAAYEERFAEADPAPEYNASHILVETEEEAKAIIEELNAGADFAETAKSKSTGPSGPEGGLLNWFGPGMMVQPFEEAVVALKKGEISAPVQTRFGWHVIKLNDTRFQDIPPLDAVREELVAELQQQTVTDYIKSLESDATIDNKATDNIDPAILKNMDLLEQ